jgi:hypothetical protein
MVECDREDLRGAGFIAPMVPSQADSSLRL